MKAQVEADRRKAQEDERLAEERAKIETERRRLEEEKQQLLAMAKRPEAPAAAVGRKTNSLGMEFVWIAPGSFEMGSPTGEAGRFDVDG